MELDAANGFEGEKSMWGFSEKSKISLIAAMIAAAFLLSGCLVEVKQYGSEWDKGAVDSALVGEWMEQPRGVRIGPKGEESLVYAADKLRLKISKEGDHMEIDCVAYKLYGQDKENTDGFCSTLKKTNVGKSLNIGKYKFFATLTKDFPKKGDNGGILYAYSFNKDGTLLVGLPSTGWVLDEAERRKILGKGKSVRADGEGVKAAVIADLNDEAKALLADIPPMTDDVRNEYWSEMVRFDRIK